MNHRNELLTILNFHNIAKDLGFLYKSSFPGVSYRIGVLQENTYGAEHFFLQKTRLLLISLYSRQRSLLI